MISIVITTQNRYSDLILCLKSIKRSTYKNFEIIIIDDNSSDETKLLSIKKIKNITKINQKIRIIHNKTKKMMVESRNIGAKLATRKYVLFIDDDNIIDENMIKILYEFAEENSEFGIIGPSMYYGDGKLYMNYQKFNFFTGKTTGVVIKNDIKQEYYESDGIPNVFMIKREVFKKIGYFDKKIIQTFTEMDFGLLAKRNNIKCCMLTRAKTIHKVFYKDNWTDRGLNSNKQKAYCIIRNRTIMIARYGSIFNKIIYLFFFSWIWPVIYSLIIIKNLKFIYLKYYWYGFIDGIKNLVAGNIKDRLKDI